MLHHPCMASETSLEPSPEHVRTPSRSGSQLTLDEETIADEGGRHNSRPGILQSLILGSIPNPRSLIPRTPIPIIVKYDVAILQSPKWHHSCIRRPRTQFESTAYGSKEQQHEFVGFDDGVEILLAEPVSAAPPLVNFKGV